MTTLVTGASGFLGSHVARQLVARGDEARVLLRPSSHNRAIADLSLQYVTRDLRHSASLARPMHGLKRGVHLAPGYGLCAKRSKDTYKSNVCCPTSLLAAAKP